jgi:hypothetical protein
MAVRVRLRLTGPKGSLTSSAVLNGGFEVPAPQLLLPARAATRLLGEFRRSAKRQEMEAAGGDVELLAARGTVRGCVLAGRRRGPETAFGVLVSDADSEILVSDAGIDALGVRIETFAPGRWRLADETVIRDTEAPQYW